MKGELVETATQGLALVRYVLVDEDDEDDRHLSYVLQLSTPTLLERKKGDGLDWESKIVVQVHGVSALLAAVLRLRQGCFFAIGFMGFLLRVSGWLGSRYGSGGGGEGPAS